MKTIKIINAKDKRTGKFHSEAIILPENLKYFTYDNKVEEDTKEHE